VVAILTGSNYQVASRIWLNAGRELALRVIVDTESCVSLVREALPTLRDEGGNLRRGDSPAISR